MTETVQALGHQVSLALETLRLAEEAKQAAITREQEQAAQERAAELERVNEALRQRDRLLSAVAQITQDLLEAENIDIAIPAALQVVGKAANISRVLLFAERQDPVTRRLKHYVEHEWVTDGFSNHASVGLSVLDNEDFHTISQPLHAGQSTWRVMDDLPDVSQWQFEKLDIKSTGAVPIFIEGQYAGCVTFDDCVTPRHWTQQEMDVLTAAADSIGAALHRKELVDRLVAERLRAEQERAAELAKANEALKRSVGYLTTADSLQSFLAAVLQESIQASGAVTAAVFVYNPYSNTLQMTALVLHDGVVDISTDPRTEIWRSPVPADTTPAWQVMSQKREIFWFDNNDSSLEHWPISIPWHKQLGHKGILTIPLLIGEQSLGFLGLCFSSYQKPSETKLEQCWTLAQHAVLALQMARLAEEAKQAAILGERNRMAREIHDSLAQVFTSVLVRLQTAQLALQDNPTEAQTYLDQTSDLARQGLSEARRSVHALRPQVLEGGNLAGALSHCLHQITHGTSVHASFHQTGQSYRLPEQLQLELFRIGQEAITNACKHAHPTTIEVELSFLSQQIQLAIQDNGQGFILADPPQSQGFGLIGMHERTQIIGGKLTISSQPQQGTQVLVTVEVDRAVTE